MKPMTKHSLDALNKLYTDADGADQEIFAEQRSNILLYSGEHYNRRNSKFYQRIRDSKELAQEQKLRLTKNHVQYICDTYVNNIVAPNPGVGFTPKNEKEVHDQKVAQLHHSVWRDAHDRYDIDDKIDDWADNFVQIGEVVTKIYFDPNRGKVKAYEQKVDDTGPLFLDPSGMETNDDGSAMGTQFEPSPNKEKAIREGEFVFEEVFGFNLLRPPECKNMAEASWLGIRKMVDKSVLVGQYPDKEKEITTSSDQTFIVFDSAKGGYTKVTDQCMVIEYYFRPCQDYPEGYFYVTTKDVVLHEDQLPGGIFPIVFQAFRKFATAPRGRSPIKTMRPYQAEINRASSKHAEHQITLGDDKIILQNGTKVSSGISLPGIRTVSVTGSDPKILPGRDGSQYLTSITQNIAELYQVLGVREDTEDLPAQLDPYTMLFRSARQKKKFQRYIKRFEKFLINVVKTYLRLAKVHLTDDALIYAIGTAERVNIAEYRTTQDICYDIEIEAQSEDIESKLGKQIAINHVIQYLGGKLGQGDIGKLMRQMPYGNFDASFDDLTLDYDNAVNDILALDRGEQPPINQHDDHVYQVKKLDNRTRQADFRYLSPQIQQNYFSKIALHSQFEAAKQLSIQRAEQGLIPTGGYLSACDLYVPDANNPNSAKRVRLPSEALQWLIKHLEAQQAGLAPLADVSTASQAQIADKFTQQGGAGGGPGAPTSSPQTMINRASMSSATAMAP